MDITKATTPPIYWEWTEEWRMQKENIAQVEYELELPRGWREWNTYLNQKVWVAKPDSKAMQNIWIGRIKPKAKGCEVHINKYTKLTLEAKRRGFTIRSGGSLGKISVLEAEDVMGYSSEVWGGGCNTRKWFTRPQFYLNYPNEFNVHSN